MNAASSPALTRNSPRAWILTSVFAAVAIVTAGGLWLAAEREKSHRRMIELQEIEIKSLQAALESESLIARSSLNQLRGVAAGRSFSAFAILQTAKNSTTKSPLTALWSDELAAGIVLLPTRISTDQKTRLEILLTGSAQTSPARIQTDSTESAQIIGFTQGADQEQPIGIILRVPQPGNDFQFESYQADWIR